MTILKSFYTLEMNVDPGGVRYAVLLVTNSIDEIKLALQIEFSSASCVELLLEYGMYVCICTYQKGNMISCIDLLSYLSVEVADGTVYTIDEDLEVTPDISGGECDCGYTMFIDWSNLEITELSPPLLLPGEVTLTNDDYVNIEITPQLVEIFLKSQIDWDNVRIQIFARAQGDGYKDFDEDVDEDLAYACAFYGWNDRELFLEMPTLEQYFAASNSKNFKVVMR